MFLFYPKLLLGLKAANHPGLLFIVMEVKIISKVEHNFRWRQLRVIELSSCALRHQNPHAAQLFSLATAAFKNLFFPDYASVGCL